MKTQIEHIVKYFLSKKDIILFIVAGLMLAAIIVRSAYLAVFLLLGIILLFKFMKYPLRILAIYILILPFEKTVFFKAPILMAGTEPLYMVAALTLFVAAINYRKSISMPMYANLFVLIILSVFVYAVLQSLTNIDIINMREVTSGKEPLSTPKYILKYLVRPLFYFLPIIVIIKFIDTKKKLEYLITPLIVSVILFSLAVLYVYFFKIPGKGSPGIANQYYGLYLGQLRNGLANFFIIGLPFLIARYYLKKNIFNIISIFLSVAAIGFLFSRTAYVILVFSFVAYLVVSKRAKFLPVLVILALGLSLVVSANILDRASKGLDSGDRSEITGRLDNIWIPIANEYLEEPGKLLFGNGRFGLITSKAVAYGVTPSDFSHPHNMYVELVLDTGIIAFIFVISIIAFITLKVFRSINQIQDSQIKEYQYAIFISMISFYISGLTGRTLFPSATSSFFWIVAGIGIAIVQLTQKQTREEQQVDIETENDKQLTV